MKKLSLDEMAANIDSLGAKIESLDAAIAEIRGQIRTFMSDDAAAADALGAFDLVAANGKLNDLLMQRHTLRMQLGETNDAFTTARDAERSAKLSALRSEYRESVVRLLQGFIAAAHAVADGERCRNEARDITGGSIGHLPHIGPPRGVWDLNDSSGFLVHWIREAKRAGFIDGSEPWLKSVRFC